MKPRELESLIRQRLAATVSDPDLRTQLEPLANEEISFGGFTWLWGPILYRRNRILFRPFILSHFSTSLRLPKWKLEAVRWKGDIGRQLDAWLTEVDQNDDVALFRRLYEWKLEGLYQWTDRTKRGTHVFNDLIQRLREASTPARRQLVFKKFDLSFELTEAAACDLYRIDPQSAPAYILPRLRTAWLSGEPKRELWTTLLQLVDQRKDEDFRWKLYRRQIPLTEWISVCLALCNRVEDPAELIRGLELRHPEGWGINLADGFFKLVERRGRDVFPYLMRHLRQVWGGWLGRGSYGKMADLAREKGYWDLWAALIRTCGSPKEFNQEVSQLVADDESPPWQRWERLLSLVGVSREWNWAGFGLASIRPLDDAVALALYQRFPDLLRGPFKLHLQSTFWGKGYPRLLEHLLNEKDEELLDFFAARLATRYGRWKSADHVLKEADHLAEYYASLKTDEAVFCRRAARILGQIPAYSIFNYHELIRQNRLARLLFERSHQYYLSDPASLADLVEAAEIHVMALAYRVLGSDDERARLQAARHLPLLLGTLLRPMQRDTRMLAFRALANAASTQADAGLVLQRARDAFLLPDQRYPKEALLGLIASVLHRWPELRAAAEQPVTYSAGRVA